MRVRQEAFYQQEPGTALLAGVKGIGDYSIYPAGRLALRWNQKTTAVINYTEADIDLNVHLAGAAPLNSGTAYSQTDGTFTNPAGDDFFLIQNEVAGARTDFIYILYKDGTTANGYVAQADNTDYFPARCHRVPIARAWRQAWQGAAFAEVDASSPELAEGRHLPHRLVDQALTSWAK